jgi:hypothetical protein
MAFDAVTFWSIFASAYCLPTAVILWYVMKRFMNSKRRPGEGPPPTRLGLRFFSQDACGVALYPVVVFVLILLWLVPLFGLLISRLVRRLAENAPAFFSVPKKLFNQVRDEMGDVSTFCGVLIWRRRRQSDEEAGSGASPLP